MKNLGINIIRFFIGVIWVAAVVVTAILLAPVQAIVALSGYFFHPENLRV